MGKPRTLAGLADGVGTSDIDNGAVTPGKLSTGAPSWDTSGNLKAPGRAITESSGANGLEMHIPAVAARYWYLSSDGVTRLGISNGSGVVSSTQLSIDASSNFIAAGDVKAYSDERLKTDWAELPADFVERLANVKHGTYTRIDTGARQAGSSAQDWQALLPK